MGRQTVIYKINADVSATVSHMYVLSVLSSPAPEIGLLHVCLHVLYNNSTL